MRRPSSPPRGWGRGGVWLGAVLAAALQGCAVGPDFVRPQAPEGAGYAREPLAATAAEVPGPGGAAQHLVASMDIPGQWWTLFHSAALDSLVAQSLAANADLQGAQAALRAADENAAAQQGVYFPALTANFTPSRQRNAVGTIAPTLTSGAPVFNLYNAQVNVSYALDVFGGNRRAVESARAEAEAQRFLLEATYLTLTSNVVAAAIQEASLRGQIAATREIIRIEREQRDLLQRQFELGDVALGDVRAQEAILGQAEAGLPALEKQLALQRNLLTALAGRLPSEEVSQTFELADLELPTELPVSLPSRLVDQRPDIRAAQAQFHAASAEVGVAIANMLPQVTLSGLYGGTSTAVAQLFSPGNVFWAASGTFSQTLFQGGTLLHRERGAVAVMDQAAAQYRSTVITAFQNVADSLRALDADALALNASVRAETASRESLEIARRRVQLGSVGTGFLLNAEQLYQQAVINTLQARANRFADTVALFQSLGGGWWNRVDVAGESLQPLQPLQAPQPPPGERP